MLNKNNLTIIIPTFNSERYINKTLNFLVNQTDSSFCVWIIDDNSSDGTAKVVRSFSSKLNLRFIVKPRNVMRGAAASINYVFKSVNTPFWALIDSDAYLHKNWVLTIKNELNSKLVAGAPIHALSDEGVIAHIIGLEIEERYSRLKEGNVNHLSTCNLAGRVEVLKFIDLSEKLSYAYDHQLSFQLRKNNVPIYLTKKTYCSHANKSGVYKYFIQQFKIAKHHLVLSKQMPEEAIKGDEISPSYLIIQPVLTLTAFLFLFFSPLASLLSLLILFAFNFHSIIYVSKVKSSYFFIFLFLILVKNLAWILGSLAGLIARSR